MTVVEQLGTARDGACSQYLGHLAQIGHVPSSLILSLGRQWTAQERPADVHLGPQRQCFQNAGLLALERDDLTYVEGYAYPAGLFPVNHAWCVDAQGRVIDNTLRQPEATDYYGVPISRSTQQTRVQESGYWGLFAEQMTLEFLKACLADVQAGAWPADMAAAEAVCRLLDSVS
jgi:hypothetical protein